MDNQNHDTKKRRKMNNYTNSTCISELPTIARISLVVSSIFRVILISLLCAGMIYLITRITAIHSIIVGLCLGIAECSIAWHRSKLKF